MGVTGTVAVGVLSLGAAASAGAATTVPAVGSHFNCANADKVLTRIQAGEAKIAAGLPKLTAAEAKATAAGHTKQAAAIQKRITRLESASFKARLVSATQKIEAKCPGSAPTAS
ncbi:MAG: hypothetical protein ACLP2J_06950 [Acidimicrobiales bacterium]|jgi:hypothetical protein